MDKQEYEDLGYDEPAASQEEYFYYTTLKDFRELVALHGVHKVMEDLDKDTREEIEYYCKGYE